MNGNLGSGYAPIIVGPTGGSGSIQVGQQIDGLFRFGCSYARLAKNGSHAWLIDLYQRKAIVTGKALVSEVPICPKGDSIVRVKGLISQSDAGVFLWVRELTPTNLVGPEMCAIDLAIPGWVVNQDVADKFSEAWASLAPSYRELISEILADPDVLRGFLIAPGSLRHHDAKSGGCIDHTVRVAAMANAIADLTPELDRDLLVAGAIVHDIGKCIEYGQVRNGRWAITRFGKRVGHKVGGALLVAAAARKCKLLTRDQEEDILHMLTCSFAPAWAGYRLPSTPEALALSAIDRLCAGKTSDTH